MAKIVRVDYSYRLMDARTELIKSAQEIRDFKTWERVNRLRLRGFHPFNLYRLALQAEVKPKPKKRTNKKVKK